MRSSSAHSDGSARSGTPIAGFPLPDRLVRPALLAALLFVVAASPVSAGTASSLTATDTCLAACPLLPPPPPFHFGEPHRFFVVARDDENAVDQSFTGTVLFASSDPKSTLPPAYRFTAADQGVHEFEFVVRTLGFQTITVSDAAGVLRSGHLARNAVVSAAVPTLEQRALPVPGGFVRGLTAGPDGKVWYSAGGGESFTGLPPIPRGFGRLTADGLRTDFDPIAANTGGVVTGSDGNLWYAAAGDGYSEPGRIGRMTPTGIVTLFVVPAVRSAPQDVALGADGNVWFADANSVIGRITPTGTITLFATPTADSVPFHITNGPDGALWFTEFGVRRIGRIDTSGAIQEFELPAGAAGPWGIAAGADGRLWFTAISPVIGSVGLAGDVRIHDNPLASESYGIGSGPDGAIWLGTLGSLVRVVPNAPVPVLQTLPVLTGTTAQRILLGPDGNLWIGQSGGVVQAAVETCGFLASGDLCLEGHFRARVEFQASGLPAATATPLFRTGNTGHFSFFTPNNVELSVKVVDGRAFNGRYWVFAGSLTNVEFTLTVTDTSTGENRIYRNASGGQASIVDTSAF